MRHLKNLNLNSLRIVESAARLGNFTRAGEENLISTSAVSQRVKAIEEQLEFKIFHRRSNAVALTFDLGGRLEPAVAIMEWLIANDVAATIFPTGSTLSGTAAGREVARLVAANPGLLTMGNHSWDHPDFTTLSASAMADQLARTDAAIVDATGIRSTPMFRPPYGAHNAAVRAAVGAAGWRYLVMWDIDTIDWRPESEGGPTVDDIRAKVLSRAAGGSIVLMHLGGWNTLEALPGIVSGLRANGLEPVTLHRLLGVDPGS